MPTLLLVLIALEVALVIAALSLKHRCADWATVGSILCAMAIGWVATDGLPLIARLAVFMAVSPAVTIHVLAIALHVIRRVESSRSREKQCP